MFANLLQTWEGRRGLKSPVLVQQGGGMGTEPKKSLSEQPPPPRDVSRPFVELGGKPRSEDSSGT